ncbi:hypothetical protein ACIBEJ_35320 [Nonomuraea sp. NPDC050790]|uniref:hypothetical protein n=1 Tax=Nonomuraea sp. NPDC050790 TaxID=3364371 RepID=UPI0037A82BF1
MRRRLCALLVMVGALLIAPPAHAATATKFSGSGDDLIKIRATTARSIVKLTHAGEANFIVWSLTPSGKKIELVANTIGDYTGTTLLNPNSTKLGAIEIKADGDWTAEVLPVSYAATWKSATIRLAGDKVLKLKTPSRGLRSVRYAHSGDGNFIVWAYPMSGSPDLLVNKIGRASGRVVLPAGTKYVTVKANGSWYLVRR